jgi:hypothetical protein
MVIGTVRYATLLEDDVSTPVKVWKILIVAVFRYVLLFISLNIFLFREITLLCLLVCTTYLP